MLRWTAHVKGGPIRFFHAAVAVGQKLYSFGVRYRNVVMGTCGEGDEIEVQVFNAVSLRWTKLPPAAAAATAAAGRGGGGGGACPAAEVPSLRYYHTVVLIEDVIYIWGGFKYTEEGYCNVLYAFDVHAHAWSRPGTLGSVPEARSGHSACASGKLMYVLGGHDWHCRWTDDIHRLDTDAMSWCLVGAKRGGTPALVSDWHTATVVGARIFVFGGRGNEDQYYGVRAFDVETGLWLSLPPPPSQQLLPEGRVGHAAFARDGELYIFGGHNTGAIFDDLWKCDAATFSWRRVEPRVESPFLSSMCCCAVGDSVVLFSDCKQEDEDDGGGGGDDDVNGVYILDLSPSLKTLCKLVVRRYGLEQSELPHSLRWELAAMAATRT